MKYLIKVLLSSAVALIIPFNRGLSQNKTSKPIIFQGKITGGATGTDSIYVNYSPSLMRTYSLAQTDGQVSFFVHPDSAGRFKFDLPAADQTGSLFLSLNGNKELLGKSRLTFMDSTYPRYYVEPGDSIHMEIQIHGEGAIGIRIYGNGADKYLAMASLSKAMTMYPQENPATGSKPAGWSPQQEAETFMKVSASRLQAQYGLLNYYKTRITPAMYRLLYADIIGREYSNVISKIRSLSQNNYTLLNSLSKQFLPILNHALSPESSHYINYVIQRKVLSLALKTNSKAVAVKQVYNMLKAEENALLRDKIITSYLLNVMYRMHESDQDGSAYNECLQDAYQEVHFREFKKDLAQKLSKFKTGSLAYNFNLPDDRGKRVQLANLKGKVVLVDIYGTICTGCRIFANTLKTKVFQVYKDNPDVAFVAISTEPNKERWLQDIADGHNTSKEHEIILYTEGLGLKHPFITNYEIQAVPTLMLIDQEGKIVNSSSASLTAASTGEEVIKMINDQLKRKEGN